MEENQKDKGIDQSTNINQDSPTVPVNPPEVSAEKDPVNNSSSPKQPKVPKWLLISGLAAVLIAVGVLIFFLVDNTSNSNTVSYVTNNKPASTPPSTKANSYNTPASINPINPAAIPLGTGKVSTTPRVGYVDFCNNKGTSVAPEPNLPWINKTNNTWDSLTKPAVQGSVSWAGSASYSVTLSGSTRTITTNDLPINHDSGVFPISVNDPAYQYDHNPNKITSQPTTWQLSANPIAAATPGCTSDGPIGVLTDGVFLFNALDADNRDAGATEILDQWQGHPQSAGMYHHHDIPNFMLKADSAKSSSTLVGYALDGYGIYVERDANGNLLTNANLDACHGRTSEVMWNGKMTDIYHYDATLEYPYTVGCFHGTPITINKTAPHGAGGNPTGNKLPPKT